MLLKKEIGRKIDWGGGGGSNSVLEDRPQEFVKGGGVVLYLFPRGTWCPLGLDNLRNQEILMIQVGS